MRSRTCVRGSSEDKSRYSSRHSSRNRGNHVTSPRNILFSQKWTLFYLNSLLYNKWRTPLEELHVSWWHGVLQILRQVNSSTIKRSNMCPTLRSFSTNLFFLKRFKKSFMSRPSARSIRNIRAYPPQLWLNSDCRLLLLWISYLKWRSNHSWIGSAVQR